MEDKLQKNNNGAVVMANILLFDEILLPVFHFAGMPFKISYLLCGIWFILYIMHTKIWVFKTQSVLSKENKSVLLCIVFLFILSLCGEAIMALHVDRVKTSPFTDALINLIFILGAYGIGCNNKNYKSKFIVYLLYAYCLVNVVLTLMGTSAPAIITSLYGEYYSTGVRIRGIGGNANTTNLVMNAIFIGVVLLYRKKHFKLSIFESILVVIMPMLESVFLNSRGELVSTLVIELVFLASMAKVEGIKAIFKKILPVVLILVMGYTYVTTVLYHTNSNVRYNIDRLQRFDDLTDVEDEENQANTLLRPLVRADVFWARFKVSPIVGTGYSFGSDQPFIKSTNGYHNDWFRVLASTGILGFMLWFSMVKRFFKNGGIIILLPFFTAGLTNTFLRSTHALIIYFFIMGVISSKEEE